MSLVLRYAARSDRGLVRSNNQDSVYAGPRLLAVADGMGGHAGGEVASKLVIAAVAPLDDDDPGNDLLAPLEHAVLAGNDAIIELVAQEPDLTGMGTTLTAILFAGRRIGLAHVGDSRAYLLRSDELTQITHDDTFVQSLIDEGRLTEEEAASHPQRSLILRALNGDDVEPTLTVRESRDGDRYLLCSDGLSGVVSTETLAEALRISDPQACADRLIELALRSGGPDNITVIVADVVDVEYGENYPIVGGAVSGAEEDTAVPDTAAGRAAAVNPARASPKRVAATSTPPRPKRSRRAVVLVVLALLVVLVLAAVLGRAWLKSNYYVGEKDGTVAVLQGLEGTVFGVALQEVTVEGCVTPDNQVIPRAPDEPATQGCTTLRVEDLRPSAREQVSGGLPGGSEQDSVSSLLGLGPRSVLPLCSTAAAEPDAPASSTTPTPASPPSVSTAVPSAPGAGTTPAPTTSAAPGTDLASPEPVPGETCRVAR